MMNVPIIVEKDIDSEHSYDIFSRLLKERIIFISGEINDATNTTSSIYIGIDNVTAETYGAQRTKSKGCYPALEKRKERAEWIFNPHYTSSNIGR